MKPLQNQKHLLTPKTFVKTLLPLCALFLTLVWFVMFSATLFSTYTNATKKTISPGVDFTAYLVGANVLKTSPNNLYNYTVQKNQQDLVLKQKLDSLLSFRNTPTVALLYLPYTFLDSVFAYKLNFYLQGFLCLLFIGCLYQFIHKSLWMLSVSLLFLPVVYQGFFGQISIVITFLFLFTYLALKNKKDFLAGFIACFFVLKFQYILVIPFLFLVSKSKKKFLLGIITSSLFLLIFDSFLYHGFYLVDYIKFLSFSETPGLGTNTLALYNLVAFFRYFRFSDIFGFAISGVLYVFSLVLVWKNSPRLSLPKFFVATTCLVLSLSPHTALVDLVFLLFPLFLLSLENTFRAKLAFAILFCTPFLSLTPLPGLGGLMLFVIGLMQLTKLEVEVPLS